MSQNVSPMKNYDSHNLPVHVVNFFPSSGNYGTLLICTIESSFEASIFDLRLAIGCKILSTTQSKGKDYKVHLSAIIPEFKDIDWHANNAPPLYIVSVIKETDGKEIPNKSKQIGIFTYVSPMKNSSLNMIVQPSSHRKDVSEVFQPTKSEKHMEIKEPGQENKITKLVFEKNFIKMKEGWSAEEIEAGRRLVIFTRRHELNTLYCDFKPLTQQEYKTMVQDGRITNPLLDINEYYLTIFPENHVVSILLNTSICYVTSYDLLLLFQFLLQEHFSHAEKTRLRRNLEAFSPFAISPNSKNDNLNDFYNRIMGYYNPMPRKIRKNLKLFRIEAVESAIKKVVLKYVRKRGDELTIIGSQHSEYA